MLSVVITTWNEEKNLPRVLPSVKRLADEIIVVDTQSTDKTVEIAKKFGCRVFHHQNTGIVEPVRNYSISKARGDWILLMDADEEISSGLAAYIKQVITTPGIDYYRLPRKNIIFGSWIKSEHWWPDYVYRLFRNGYVTWSPAVHSIPQTRGVGGDFPPEEKYAIIHHNYQTVSQYVDRINRYTDNQLQLLIDSGAVFSWKLLITKPSEEFFSQYFARNGYREGLHGLLLSGLQAFSELVLYAKYWQYLGFKPENIPPREFILPVRRKISQFQWWYYEKLVDKSPLVFRPFIRIIKDLSVIISKFI